MRYTMQSGVERPLLARIIDKYKLLVPLLLLLFFVGYVGLSGSSPGQKPAKPLTLGIYTIKSNGKSPNPSADKNNKSSNQPANAPIITASGESYSMTTAAPVYAAPAANLQGGMGGGGSIGSIPIGGGSGGGTGGGSTGGTGGGTGSTTFPCVDITSGLTVTCTYQACAPPLTLTGSHKAYVSTTGTCVVVN